jgi:MFS family permease
MLRPVAQVSPAELIEGKRALVKDDAWAAMTGALSGGVLLVAFALALGATPLHIGLLAAIPFVCQAAQLPGVLVVDRIRQRRRIAVVAVTIARVAILSLAFLPFLPEGALRLYWLIAAQFLICALGSLGGCAINSWLHQLLPLQGLGAFFARRLFWSTAMACGGTLFAGLLVDELPVPDKLLAYGTVFALAGVAGFISSYYLARVPEPQMLDAGPKVSILTKLRAPLSDPNFRRLLIYLAAWNVASNLAAPFLTVYLMTQLGYGLTMVTTLWVTSQIANALTLYLWGKLSDRLSNKAVLSVALPVYFLCTFGLVFADAGGSPRLQLALLYGLHVVMGAAMGGIGLATGNLGLKLAPQGQGTTYLAAIGLVSSIAGGVAPIAAGALAQWLEKSQLSVLVRWVLPPGTGEVAVFSFAHWEFLFALSAAAGLYVLHRLSRIDEGAEISERRVIQEFALEAVHTVNHLSSLGGLLGSLFPFDRLNERRRFARAHGSVRGGASAAEPASSEGATPPG